MRKKKEPENVPAPVEEVDDGYVHFWKRPKEKKEEVVISLEDELKDMKDNFNTPEGCLLWLSKRTKKSFADKDNVALVEKLWGKRLEHYHQQYTEDEEPKKERKKK